MNELTIDGKVYVSSKRAAEITGYAKDYIGQMCREGRVEARLVGRAWYVLESSLREHRFGSGTKESEPEAPAKPSITDTWATLRYESEPEAAPVVLLPEKQPVNVYERASEALSESETTIQEPQDSANTLADLQSAWKDWFTRRELPAPTEEERSQDAHRHEEEASQSAYEPTEAPVAAPEPVYVAEAVPAEPMTEEEDTEAVPVPIERIRARPRMYVPEPLPEQEPEGIIVHERVRRRKGYPAAYAALALVSVVAVLVAVFGSGVLDPYIGGLAAHIPSFVSGAHVYTR